MGVVFLDNYPIQNLKNIITKKDGSPLFGEVWVYEQFHLFNENNLLPNETWYLKHSCNLSTHPASRKIEGEIDFLLLSKYGLLAIEVKGGSINVDENDCYYSSKGDEVYTAQNPFIQAKEYVHSLIELIANPNVFVYRAVVFPHEAGFKLSGLQLTGYKDVFFSKADYDGVSSEVGINKIFFKFIKSLAKSTRINNLKAMLPNCKFEAIQEKAFERYPLLSSTEIRRLKSQLFPTQTSYGYNPQKINEEVILKENYEILRGLERNRMIMVQGAPGTGKTVLATKFIADKLLKQQKGIVFCSNKLLRAKLEHILIKEYELDSNFISFRIFTESSDLDKYTEDIDFLVFDEAQEYFDKGLYDFIELSNQTKYNPHIMVLYDPEQSIIGDFKELSWYTDFFVVNGFSHYHFNTMYRCVQNKDIIDIAQNMLSSSYLKVKDKYEQQIFTAISLEARLAQIKGIIDDNYFTNSEKIILIDSFTIEQFEKHANDYFRTYFVELTEQNVNINTNKIKYTTPIKYRGLECKSVYLITNGISERNRVQLYIGVTRAIQQLKILLWEDN